MAVRRLEELDLAQGIIARALLSELAGAGNGGADRPLEQTVVVTPTQLLAYDAVRRACRYVHDAEEFLRQQVGSLRRVTFWSSPGSADPDAPLARFDEVALFNIVEIREWLNADAGADAPANAATVHWMVRGGLWAGSHLRPPCRGPLCQIAQASLEPKRESAALLALRIGSLAMADACPRAARSPLTMTVEALLAALGRLPVPQLRTTVWARRTADDLSDAARALRAAGFFDRTETPAWPLDAAANSGAIDRWLEAESSFAFRPGGW